MDRNELKQLAEMRLSDAKALLATGANDAGAYYLAGYAIECAIKACIAKNQGEFPFPPRLRDKDLTENYYTHNLAILIQTAGLRLSLEAECRQNSRLNDNWSTVVSWNEQFRYTTLVVRNETEELISAIDEPQNGVLTWLMQYW